MSEDDLVRVEALARVRVRLVDGARQRALEAFGQVAPAYACVRDLDPALARPDRLSKLDRLDADVFAAVEAGALHCYYADLMASQKGSKTKARRGKGNEWAALLRSGHADREDAIRTKIH